MMSLVLKQQLRKTIQLKLSRLEQHISKMNEQLALMEIEANQTRDDLARLDAEINEVKTNE